MSKEARLNVGVTWGQQPRGYLWRLCWLPPERPPPCCRCPLPWWSGDTPPSWGCDCNAGSVSGCTWPQHRCHSLGLFRRNQTREEVSSRWEHVHFLKSTLTEIPGCVIAVIHYTHISKGSLGITTYYIGEKVGAYETLSYVTKYLRIKKQTIKAKMETEKKRRGGEEYMLFYKETEQHIPTGDVA